MIIHHLKTSVRIKRLLTAALALMLIVSLGGCSKDDDGAGSQLSTLALIERGWDSFENMDYTAALNDFQEVMLQDQNLSDAWNGAGWSAGRLNGRLGESAEYFAGCLQRDTTRYDALGGWAFVAYQSADYNGALQKADSLLHRRSGWRFLHQPSIDFHDVQLMMAAAYYNIEDYASSLNVVVLYLNPSFEADINTTAGRRELLDEIERLRQIYG